MKHLNVPVEIKSINEEGFFEGYASIFGNVDLGGDVIEQGAFKEIVKGKNGKVKILNQHNMHDPVGTATVKQDKKGLAFKGQLILEAESAKSVYALMKGGALDGMSIGYDVLDGGSKILESGIRQLKSLKLWEISLVTFGMNPLAGVESVKNAPMFKTVRELEFWLRDELKLSNGAAKDFIKRFKSALNHDESHRDDVESELKNGIDYLNNITKELS
jgi:HK97 family phage prohead protease